MKQSSTTVSHIFAVGETILDIIFKEGQPQAARPGGSAFNAAITLGRLGTPVTMISEMGDDRVGDLIAAFMEENGVDTGSLSRYEEGQSAIALAFLNEESDAEYQFYKDYPHQRLQVEAPEFGPHDLLLFGSFYALNPGIRPRLTQLLQKASDAGVLILYDPNFRSTHMPEREELVPVILENMDYATVVRASDEDLQNIFHVDGPEEAWEHVRRHSQVLVYTANANGVTLFTEHQRFHMEVEVIEPISTIGAGDTFNAGIIYGLYLRGIRRDQIGALGKADWEQILTGAMEFSKEVCLSYDNYLPVELALRIKKRDSSSDQYPVQ
ncbi:MAG: carbohydrate kinase family protein [Bacteroidales bacterium]